MGCKGKKRREKNYEAAHGGKNSRLPPPPDSSSIDALPTKLRRIMPFMGAEKKPSNLLRQSNGSADAKGNHSGEKSSLTTSGTKRKASDESSITQRMEFKDGVPRSSTVEENNNNKKKKKRTQSKQANDLRFEKGAESGAVVSKRKERKKQRLKERKKNKRSQEEKDMDFPGREQVNFGDIVEAPPKLTAVPKAFKINQDASKERLRLQAIESYRNRKGWQSRPGVQLPTALTTSPPL